MISLERNQHRDKLWLTSSLFLLLSTLVIDGFPAGISILREFGARPTNFILLVAMIILGWRRLVSASVFAIPRRFLIWSIVLCLGIPALNIPVAILQQSDTSIPDLILDWSKQYAMLLWGVASYWIWRKLLRPIPIDQLSLLMCIGSIIPLVSFYSDLTASTTVQDVLGAVRIKLDPRPSGLATEPSLYAAWVAFAWPLILYYGMHAKSFGRRALGMILFAAMCLSAYLSHARTIAVIVALQIAYYGYWATRHSRGLTRLRTLVAVALLAIATALAFAASLSSLTNVEIGSNISRFGSTVTAIRVSLAHPVLGIGIGQLTHFFGVFAPDFALVSQEILSYSSGLSEFRASSFNLFVRFVCEFGVAIGVVFSILVVRPVTSAIALRSPERKVAFTILSAIGGVGFWLTQDQYGYQPAILSLAILSNVVSARAADLPSDSPEHSQVSKPYAV